MMALAGSRVTLGFMSGMVWQISALQKCKGRTFAEHLWLDPE